MAFMKSGVRDYDGNLILASCPFYHDNPLCINSCACFLPLIHKDEETGMKKADFNFGWCGVVGRGGNLLSACSQEEEINTRRASGKRLRS